MQVNDGADHQSQLKMFITYIQHQVFPEDDPFRAKHVVIKLHANNRHSWSSKPDGLSLKRHDGADCNVG
jgi:hypothetical protein